MASDKEYLAFVLDQLSNLKSITTRPMMGEYIIYYRGKIIGGIYDNRFLIKPTNSVKNIINHPQYEIPYEGAKPMILVEDIDNKHFLTTLITSIYNDLPTPPTKK